MKHLFYLPLALLLAVSARAQTGVFYRAVGNTNTSQFLATVSYTVN